MANETRVFDTQRQRLVNYIENALRDAYREDYNLLDVVDIVGAVTEAAKNFEDLYTWDRATS